jgi:predicted phosphodiesterase
VTRQPFASVAVLADIHGNLPALRAVLAEPDVAAAEAVVLLGEPLMVTLDIDGLGPTLFCHASPRRDDEMLLVDSPPERWEAALSGLGSGVQVVVCGHTHMPFDRLAAGRRVINPGSVGMPYGPPGAHCAVLGSDACCAAPSTTPRPPPR